MRRLFADTTPLRTPDFRRLWLAGIVTVIGGNLTIFAVPVQLYALTRNSAYVGLSGIFALVPLIVFGLLGGAWADAMDRRLLLIIASCGLALASVLLWLQAALALNNVWMVLSLLAVQQAFFAINSPTRGAAIPRMIPIEQLPAANSLNMTVQQFGAIVGPLLAGLMLRWIDLSTLYLIDAVTCVLPIWATFRLAPMPATESADVAGGSRWGVGAVLEGFRYLAGNQVVLMSFVVDLIAMIFGMPRALFPQMAHESFGGPVTGGTTMALLAGGDVRRRRRRGRLLRMVSEDPPPGTGRRAGHRRVGGGHGRVRGDRWPGPRSGRPSSCGLRWCSWQLAGQRTWCRRRSARRSCRRSASDDLRGRLQGVFLVVVAGGPRLADAVHGAGAAMVGTTRTAAGGGVLVVIGVVLAAVAVPAFVRYRVGPAKT